MGPDTALTFLQRHPSQRFWGECVTLRDRPWRLTAPVHWLSGCANPRQRGLSVQPCLWRVRQLMHRAGRWRLSPSVDAATAGALPGSRQLWPGSLVVQDGLPRHLGLPVFFVRDHVVTPRPRSFQPLDEFQLESTDCLRPHSDGQIPHCCLRPRTGRWRFCLPGLHRQRPWQCQYRPGDAFHPPVFDTCRCFGLCHRTGHPMGTRPCAPSTPDTVN